MDPLFNLKPMPTQPVERVVCRIVSELFEVPDESLSADSCPDTIERWDSVGHLNLVLALEQEFGVRFSPDQIEQMTGVGAIVAILQCTDLQTDSRRNIAQ